MKSNHSTVDPVAIVVNSRFLPRSVGAGHSVGAAGFVLRVARELAALELFGGFVLYRRDDSLTSIQHQVFDRLGYNAVEIRFNFSLAVLSVKNGLRRALRTLTTMRGTHWGSIGDARGIVPYYQTGSLLQYHPEEHPFLVTHHAPFVSDVTDRFGEQFAAAAFQGGERKVIHLRKTQASGVASLQALRGGIALELSSIQTRYLRKEGVAASQIIQAPPPISIPKAEVIRCSHDIHFQNQGDKITLLSCAARVDTFKNLELLIDTGNQLFREGYPVQLLIAAGSLAEGHLRRKLQRRISRSFVPAAKVVPRFSQQELLYTFSFFQSNGVFVFPSRFETLGITPIEAAMSGMVTIVSDDANCIGVSEIFPKEFRFTASREGLLAKSRELLTCDVRDLGMHLKSKISNRVSPQDFMTMFLEALTRASSHIPQIT